jgi:hypothetical protein
MGSECGVERGMNFCCSRKCFEKVDLSLMGNRHELASS